MEEDNQTSPKDTFEEGVDNVTINTEEDDKSTDDTQKQSEEETAGKNKSKPEIDYKEKFAASTAEAQRLAIENKTLQGEIEKGQGRYSTLEADKNEMEKRFADEDPEKYDSIRTRKELSDLKEKMLLQEERGAVDDYIKSNPKAEGQKEALKRLGRAFPDKTYTELWNENFKPYIPEGDGSDEDDKKVKTKSAPEKGDGTITEMVGGITLEEFRKLPLAKRKAILIKQGGTF